MFSTAPILSEITNTSKYSEMLSEIRNTNKKYSEMLSLAEDNLNATNTPLIGVYFQFGVTMCHPTYATCIGPTILVNSTGSIHKWDVGNADFAHLFHLFASMKANFFSDSTEDLKIDWPWKIFKDWPWKILAEVQYRHSFTALDGNWTWSDKTGSNRS